MCSASAVTATWGCWTRCYDVRDKVTLVSPRHEQCAGHMADAYFRVRHSPVATLTSTGPGSANMVMSLATALADSSAFLAITSNVPTSQMNRAPFQELYKHNQADFPNVLRPVVKRSFQPTSRRHAAARAAPGVRHHGDGPAGTREPRHPVQRVSGGGRRRSASSRASSGAASAGGLERRRRRSLESASSRRSGRYSSSATVRRCPRRGPS